MPRFLLPAMMIALAAPAKAAECQESVKQSEAFTEAVYKEYIKIYQIDGVVIFKMEKDFINKYASISLNHYLKSHNSDDDLDVDYFLVAQDYEKSWLKSVKAHGRMTGNRTFVEVVDLGSGDERHELTVTLLCSGKDLKISSVKGPDLR